MINLDLVKKLAGSRNYKLGQQKGLSGLRDFSLDSRGTQAFVDEYQVRLRFKGDAIEGECSCPESDGFDFCQHCVQLALYANQVNQQLLSLSKGPDKSKVLAYLLSLEKKELAKQMLALLESNNEAFRRYLLKASIGAEELDFKALRQELTQLTRSKERLFSQRQVKLCFSRIEVFLQELETVAQQSEPEPLLKLLEYGVMRLNRLLERVEDRANLREASVNMIAGLYQRLFISLAARPTTQADRFLKLWLQDRHRVLGADPSLFFPHAPVWAALLQKLYSRWKKEQFSGDLEAKKADIAQLLLAQQKLEIDPAHVLGFREILADSPKDFLALAQDWSALDGHAGEFRQVLQRALERFPGDTALNASLFASLLDEPAHEHELIRCFKVDPIDFFKPLQTYGERYALGEAFERELWSAMEQDERLDVQHFLLGLLLERDQLSEARKWLETIQADSSLRIEFALRTMSSRPEESVTILQQEILGLLEKNMASADRKAAALLKQVEEENLQGMDDDSFVRRLQRKAQKRPSFIQAYQQLVDTSSPR